MRRALLTAALLVPTLAVAQVTVTETGDKPDGIINIAECQGATGASSTFAFRWSFSNTSLSQVDVRISDTSGCPLSTSNSTAHTTSLGTFTGTTTTTSIASPDLLGRIGVPTSACTSGSNLTIYVCVVPTNSSGTEISGSTLTNTFLLDRTVPATPDAPTVTPGDAALRVSWNAVSGSRISYRIDLRLAGDPLTTAPVRSDEVGNSTSTRIGNLTIGTTYDVRVVATSEGGNESAPSPATPGTPVQVNDFWRMYRDAGGAEQGGCSTSGPASLALLAFAPLALRRRRS